jgi:hypothetical protein
MSDSSGAMTMTTNATCYRSKMPVTTSGSTYALLSQPFYGTPARCDYLGRIPATRSGPSSSRPCCPGCRFIHIHAQSHRCGAGDLQQLDASRPRGETDGSGAFEKTARRDQPATAPALHRGGYLSPGSRADRPFLRTKGVGSADTGNPWPIARSRHSRCLCLQWRMCVETAIHFGRQLPADRYMEVR